MFQDLTIDLGSIQKIKRITTQFEFSSYYYQYTLEYSKDGKTWKMYADKSNNQTPESPMIDDNNVNARYMKLTVTGTEKSGLYAAVWNIKIYSSLFDIPLQLKSKKSDIAPAERSKKEMLVNLNLTNFSKDESLSSIKNKGALGGSFTKKGDVTLTIDDEGVIAIKFTNGSLFLDKPVPKTLAWNGSYTIATWVKNPEISNAGEILASWCDRHEFGLANSYNALAYNSGHYGAAPHLDGHFDMKYNKLPKANVWHHIVLTFDGVVEKIYVDGVLDNAQNMFLSSAIANAKIIIGSSDIGENYSGYMSSLRMYDYALNNDEITILLLKTKPKN